MQEKELWEQELKNATSSYRTMPMWMRRIEEKTRKTTSSTRTEPTTEVSKVNSKRSKKERAK